MRLEAELKIQSKHRERRDENSLHGDPRVCCYPLPKARLTVLTRDGGTLRIVGEAREAAPSRRPRAPPAADIFGLTSQCCRSPALPFMSAVRCAAFRSAALPVGGSRRVVTEVDSSIFAEGFCFLAAPKRGERPHQRQSEPNFSLRLLVSQLSSSPAFLCKPLEHARHVHRKKPVSMDFRPPNIS